MSYSQYIYRLRSGGNGGAVGNVKWWSLGPNWGPTAEASVLIAGQWTDVEQYELIHQWHWSTGHVISIVLVCGAFRCFLCYLCPCLSQMESMTHSFQAQFRVLHVENWFVITLTHCFNLYRINITSNADKRVSRVLVMRRNGACATTGDWKSAGVRRGRAGGRAECETDK